MATRTSAYRWSVAGEDLGNYTVADGRDLVEMLEDCVRKLAALGEWACNDEHSGDKEIGKRLYVEVHVEVEERYGGFAEARRLAGTAFNLGHVQSPDEVIHRLQDTLFRWCTGRTTARQTEIRRVVLHSMVDACAYLAVRGFAGQDW